MIGSLSVIGLPPLGGFVSKWYLALGALDRDALWVVIVLLISSLLNAFYLLPVAVRLFRNEESDEDSGIKEAPWPCVLPLALTALGCFALFFLSRTTLALGGINGIKKSCQHEQKKKKTDQSVTGWTAPRTRERS